MSRLTLEILRRHGRRKAPKNTPQRGGHTASRQQQQHWRQHLLSRYGGGGHSADVEDKHRDVNSSRGGTRAAEIAGLTAAKNLAGVEGGSGIASCDESKSKTGGSEHNNHDFSNTIIPSNSWEGGVHENKSSTATAAAVYSGRGKSERTAATTADIVERPRSAPAKDSEGGACSSAVVAVKHYPSGAVVSATGDAHAESRKGGRGGNRGVEEGGGRCEQKKRRDQGSGKDTGGLFISNAGDLLSDNGGLVSDKGNTLSVKSGSLRSASSPLASHFASYYCSGSCSCSCCSSSSGSPAETAASASASAAAGFALEDIELVNLHNLSLHKLEGMEHLTHLRVADLSGNELHDTAPLRYCECLEVFIDSLRVCCEAGCGRGRGAGAEGSRIFCM